MDTLFSGVSEGYRVERKYFLSQSAALALRSRLDPVMHRDPHSDARRHYSIASVYLDDRDDHALLSSLLGLQRRKKYRVRAYNGSDDFLSVECKRKEGSLSWKTSFRISRTEYDALLSGDPAPLLSHDCDLARELYCDMRVNGYRFRSIVAYDREVYVHPIERVRITFDTNLRGAVGRCDLFSPGHLFPILAPDVILLEVKYRHFLPDFIADLLPRDAMPATANCKYARARAIDY